MVDNVFQIQDTFLLAGPDGLLDGVEHHRGSHRGCHPPAQDSSRVSVDDEGNVGDPRPRRYIGQVGDPQPIRCRRTELALHQIRRAGCAGVGDRGAPGLAPGGAGQAQFGHQPLHGATGHRDSLAVQRQPHLASSVYTVITRMYPTDVSLEFLVADLTAAGFTVVVLVVSRWGDRHTPLGPLCADRLDPPPQTIRTVAVALMISDEPGDQCCGRSSSAAKKADAVFKIELALRNSAFSRFNRLSSADSSVVVPAREPESTWAWRTHLRTVSAQPTPSRRATSLIAAHSEPCSSLISATIRTARSRSSGGYLLDEPPDMTPTFPRSGVSGHAGAVQHRDDIEIETMTFCLRTDTHHGLTDNGSETHRVQTVMRSCCKCDPCTRTLPK